MDNHITAVVVNYRSSDHVSALLDSLQGLSQFRVVLVDNYWSDDEQLALRELARRWPVVDLVLLEQNLGFGAAMNLAVNQHCHSDEVLWILNPDTLPTPDVARQLHRELAQHPDAIISPTLTRAHRKPGTLWFAGGSVSARAGIVRMRTGRAEAGSPGLVPVSFLPATAMMLTRSTWQRLGGFREDLFLYWEDTDLCLRATALGIPLLWARHLSVPHVVGGSFDGQRRGRGARYHYFTARNRFIALRDHVSPGMLLFGAGLPNTLLALLRAITDLSGPIASFGAAVRGIRDGVRAANGREGVDAVAELSS